MNQDSVPIAEALASAGVEDVASMAIARALLDGLKLTNPHRDRVSTEKLVRVRDALAGHFFLHCPEAACTAAGKASGKPGLVVRKHACSACGGSNARRAVHDALEACARAGIKKVCVVGGSPAIREELLRTVGHALRLTLVDGTQTPDLTQARAHVRGHDVVVILGSSELNHKLSNVYEAHRADGHVITVARRGVESIAEGLAHHARLRSSQR